MITDADDTPPHGLSAFRVNNAINECVAACLSFGQGPRALNALERYAYLMLHRVSAAERGPENHHPIPDQELTGPKLAEWQAKILSIRRAAYHFLVRYDGVVDQCLPLSRRGCHAFELNSQCIGVAVVGDGRKWPMTPLQHRALVRLGAVLLPLSGGLRVVGHDELPQASSDQSKTCPGKYYELPSVIAAINARLPTGWETRTAADVEYIATQAGVTL